MKTVQLIMPEYGVVVPLLSDLQKDFNLLSGNAAVFAFCNAIRSQREDRYFYEDAQPITLTWHSDKPLHYRLEISESAEFMPYVRMETDEEKAVVYNLKAGQHYFWRVNDSDVGEFTTESQCPRWIYAPGYRNIRDMGGYRTDYGFTVKQGLAYRGGKLDGPLNPRGAKILRDLGIKTEIDLRQEMLGVMDESPLGFNYLHFACDGYQEFFEEKEGYPIKMLFDLFADESLYPIYFHCAGGADRTGTVAFLLGAVLGVNEQDLMKDYELTELQCLDTDIIRTRDGEAFMRFRNYLDSGAWGDGDYRQKAIRALHAFGVQDSTLDRIRTIFS